MSSQGTGIPNRRLLVLFTGVVVLAIVGADLKQQAIAQQLESSSDTEAVENDDRGDQLPDATRALAWSPDQATGKPNTFRAGDRSTAWASLTSAGQPEWLLLEYENAVEPKSVVIHETFNPGAVNKVSVFDREGNEHVAWTGDDPTPVGKSKGISKIKLKANFKTDRVKIYIDSPGVPGWNEIDAVGLVDKTNKTQWAVAAEASSTYAQLVLAQRVQVQQQPAQPVLLQAAPGAGAWAPEQAIGEPNTPMAGDFQTAWASLTPDGQPEWLMLDYKNAVVPQEVAIHETHNPGAVYKVSVFDADGNEHEAWTGDDPTPAGRQKGVSKIRLNFDFEFKTDRIKIYVDSPGIQGWNEIDAVGLVDKAGKTQWAIAAQASSTYAQQIIVQQADFADRGDVLPRAPQGRGWAPEQATGKPNTLMAGDISTAWASLTPDAQPEWLLLKYEDAVRPKEIVIHETHNPGAVNKVSVFDADGKEHVVWEGEDPTEVGAQIGISVIPVEVKFKTKRVKIYVDSPSVPGWNEIDAVGIRDADGDTHWAAEAEASTTFAQARGMPADRPVFIPAQQLQKFTELEKDVERLQKDVERLKRIEVELKELKELIKNQTDKK